MRTSVSAVREQPAGPCCPARARAEILALLRELGRGRRPGAAGRSRPRGRPASPKRVVLSARRDARLRAAPPSARLGGPGQWVLTLPPTYVAGVQVLFRSVRRRHRAGAAEDADAADAATRRYVSLVPTQLCRLLDERRRAPLARLRRGADRRRPARRRGCAPRPRRRGVRVVQTYGMSETCGGCVYDGVPLDGVEVRDRRRRPRSGIARADALRRVRGRARAHRRRSCGTAGSTPTTSAGSTTTAGCACSVGSTTWSSPAA